MDFQRRYVLGLPQLDPILDEVADAFASAYELYDLPFANFMMTSFRTLTGGTMTYSASVFLKSGNHNFSAFFRAAADMEYFIAAANDLLSHARVASSMRR